MRLLVRRLPCFPDPEDAFARLYAHSRNAYWLDSSRAQRGLARFSFMGSDEGPLGAVVRYRHATGRLCVSSGRNVAERTTDIFGYLSTELDRSRLREPAEPCGFAGGFVGYFGYELKALCDGAAVHRSATPDAAFIFSDRAIVFDHLRRECRLLCVVEEGGERAAGEWLEATARLLAALPPPRPSRRAAWTPLAGGPLELPPPVFHLRRREREYLADIQTCRRYLHDGESYEICLTNQIETASRAKPWDIYRALRRINPAPYAAFLRLGDLAVLSSSPERFLKIDRRRGVEAKPIKGTAARGQTIAEDRRRRLALRDSEKDRAENLMIVDLLRNDLGCVCEVGSVHVPKLMDVESYETVHQMVSTIRGRLRADHDVIDCVKAAFPGGSMTGAPKIRTMEILDRLEPGPRGIYSGALGYLSLSGEVDLSIVIRTLVCDGERMSVGTGGAITVQSDPDEEFRETVLKALPLMRAVAAASSPDADPGRFTLEGRLGDSLAGTARLTRSP